MQFLGAWIGPHSPNIEDLCSNLIAEVKTEMGSHLCNPYSIASPSLSGRVTSREFKGLAHSSPFIFLSLLLRAKYLGLRHSKAITYTGEF